MKANHNFKLLHFQGSISKVWFLIHNHMRCVGPILLEDCHLLTWYVAQFDRSIYQSTYCMVKEQTQKALSKPPMRSHIWHVLTFCINLVYRTQWLFNFLLQSMKVLAQNSWGQLWICYEVLYTRGMMHWMSKSHGFIFRTFFVA
jgi:hypothetical protein